MTTAGLPEKGGLLFVILCLLFWAASTTFANASVLGRIAADFKPVSGYVVKVAHQDVYIDLDEGKGIGVGDLFAVLGTGEPLVHPVTGNVIGHMEVTKAILQVQRLKEGYSRCRVIESKAAIEAGDKIQRFENLSAAFWDYTGEGRMLFNDLKISLPGLKWLSYDLSQEIRPSSPARSEEPTTVLTFVLTEAGLAVHGPDFGQIRAYAVPPVAAKKSDPPLMHRPEYAEGQTIGDLALVTAMADFMNHGGRKYMASTDASRIRVHKVSDRLQQVAEEQPPFPGQILAVKWWQPEINQPGYVAVSSWNADHLASYLYVFDGVRLKRHAENLPLILGTFDRDGNGRPETLLGQRFDSEVFFGQTIRVVTLKNNKARFTAPDFFLPPRFTVIGGIMADLTGDGEPEISFVRDGVLFIYRGKKRLYETDRQMGGSLSVLTYVIDDRFEAIKTTTAVMEISPAAADLDGDGQAELLVPAVDRSLLTVPSARLGIQNPQLAVIQYRNGRFVKGAIDRRLDGSVQGMTAGNGRLLLMLSHSASAFTDKGSSYLFWIPIAGQLRQQGDTSGYN